MKHLLNNTLLFALTILLSSNQPLTIQLYLATHELSQQEGTTKFCWLYIFFLINAMSKSSSLSCLHPLLLALGRSFRVTSLLTCNWRQRQSLSQAVDFYSSWHGEYLYSNCTQSCSQPFASFTNNVHHQTHPTISTYLQSPTNHEHTLQLKGLSLGRRVGQRWPPAL